MDMTRRAFFHTLPAVTVATILPQKSQNSDTADMIFEPVTYTHNDNWRMSLDINSQSPYSVIAVERART